ncbi:hypothetical protein [Deinococcus pimensis]|uniref:hypothetical protein n=1 Tax=Deinococcus pimensis TaxID=309888 RepID=UPI0004889F30|nr:hypothetical protein [Deinococcus pimensis]
MTQMTHDRFDLDAWLRRHEADAPHDLERALAEVPSDQRTLALLEWLSHGDLRGERIQLRLN